MNNTIRTLAILSATVAVTAAIASLMPTAAFAQQASIGVGSTNGGTVGGASAANEDGTSAAVSGGALDTFCLGTSFAAISFCDQD